MKNNTINFTLFECVMVVVILLFVAAFATRALVRSIKVSEENTIHAAAKEYFAVRTMYPVERRAFPVAPSGADSTGIAIVFNTPAH